MNETAPLVPALLGSALILWLGARMRDYEPLAEAGGLTLDELRTKFVMTLNTSPRPS